jgi:sugar lactone lactonase YvrE
MKTYEGAASVLSAQASLGECPVWSVRERALYFADILAPAIHRFDPVSRAHGILPMPEHVGCFGLRRDGGFIAAMRSGVFLLDDSGRVERKVADNPTDPAHSRFNDGRVDAWGRFWCGTIWQPRDQDRAVLCRLDPDFSFRVIAGDLLVSNGLAFSPARDRMYHTDTPKHVLYVYPLDPVTGHLGGRTVLKRFPEGQGRPDGAAVDAEGCYWTALFDGGRVVRLSPTGEVLAEVELPVRWPTMVAFGGPDLKTLFVTSSRENRSAQELAQYPLSGDLFAVTVDVSGVPEPEFAG